MTQSITLGSGPTPSSTSRAFGSMLGKLLAAGVLLATCGLAAWAMLDGSSDALPAQPPASALPVMPLLSHTGATSVPDASAVFAGREIEIEEPAPTF